MTAAGLAVDTSVAIAHLVRSHPQHRRVRKALDGRRVLLTAHSLAETYSVLTRLPGDARVTAADAVQLVDAGTAGVLLLPDRIASRVHGEMAAIDVSGGAVYDALVALAAREAGVALATRDARALATYRAVGVAVEVLGD